MIRKGGTILLALAAAAAQAGEVRVDEPEGSAMLCAGRYAVANTLAGEYGRHAEETGSDEDLYRAIAMQDRFSNRALALAHYAHERGDDRVEESVEHAERYVMASLADGESGNAIIAGLVRDCDRVVDGLGDEFRAILNEMVERDMNR